MKKSLLTVLWSSMLLTAANAREDPWKDALAKESKREFVFSGNFRVVAVTRRDNALDGRHHVELFRDGKAVATLYGVRIESLAASPKEDVFVGLGSGFLEGSTAVIIFGRDGTVLMSVSHAVAEFEPCPPDGSRKSKWYEELNPSIRFDEGFITLNGCRGERIELLRAVASAIERKQARFMRE